MPQHYSSHRYNLNHIQDIESVLNQALNLFKRVSVFRFDVHYPNFHPDDPTSYRTQEFTKKFLGSLTSKLEHMTGQKAAFYYLWCKEHNIEKGTPLPHYHFALILNGNQFQSWGRYDYQGPCLRICIEQACLSAMGLPSEYAPRVLQYGDTVNICTYAGKDYQPQWDEAVSMLSYLAKRDGKIPGQRCWGKSALY
ncbi:YagK/YfjJ domain-containing protein [Vibrio chagasii]|nr:inovirus-type Gp2 protein [Vibrio chagasii]MCY9829452.1 inovirus-type Gp2 protein [Vibrio chagasii]